MKYVKVFEPLSEAGFGEQLLDCLKRVSKSESNKGWIYKINIFLKAERDKDYYFKKQEASKIVENFFGDHCPAFSVLAQKPFNRFGISLEVGYHRKAIGEINYKSFNGRPYAVIEDSNHRELWAGGLGYNSTSGFIERDADKAFQEMVNLLSNEGMNLDHVIRQWNYVGEITRLNRVEGREIQNYQVFNEVRSQYFEKYRKRSDFPAATGIGTSFPGVSIDLLAVEEFGQTQNFAVNNNNQEAPYEYGQGVLVGKTLPNKKTKQPPQFERARFFSTSDFQSLYLSGTASILGEKTVGKKDLKRQISVTADNLTTLLKTAKDAEKSAAEFLNITFLRVYVKKEQDIESAKEECFKKFPYIPISFVEADVCRDDLLVEIEGEAVFYADEKGN